MFSCIFLSFIGVRKYSPYLILFSCISLGKLDISSLKSSTTFKRWDLKLFIYASFVLGYPGCAVCSRMAVLCRHHITLAFNDCALFRAFGHLNVIATWMFLLWEGLAFVVPDDAGHWHRYPGAECFYISIYVWFRICRCYEGGQRGGRRMEVSEYLGKLSMPPKDSVSREDGWGKGMAGRSSWYI